MRAEWYLTSANPKVAIMQNLRWIGGWGGGRGGGRWSHTPSRYHTYFTKWETRKASSAVVNELGRGPSCKLLALFPRPFRSALGKFNCVLWLFVTIRIQSKTRRWILGYVPRSYSRAHVLGYHLNCKRTRRIVNTSKCNIAQEYNFFRSSTKNKVSTKLTWHILNLGESVEVKLILDIQTNNN